MPPTELRILRLPRSGFRIRSNVVLVDGANSRCRPRTTYRFSPAPFHVRAIVPELRTAIKRLHDRDFRRFHLHVDGRLALAAKRGEIGGWGEGANRWSERRLQLLPGWCRESRRRQSS